MKILLFLIVLLSNYCVWANTFEQDLDAIKSKYQVLYDKEESTKWEEVTEDDLEGDFSAKVEKTINRADLMLNFQYFFFKDQIGELNKVNGEMSQVGVDLEMIFNTGSLLDVLFYGSYAFTSHAVFVGSENVYDTPNTYNIALGGYWTRGFSRINPFATLEFEGLSSMGVEMTLPFGNVYDKLRGNSIQSINLIFGVDHPFYLATRPTYLRAYLGTAFYGVSKLVDSDQEEKVNIFKIGTDIKMNVHANILLLLGWKGEIITGITNSYLSHFDLNIGCSF